MQPHPETAPSSVLFARGVIARLAIWSALRIAVQESWGGPEAPEKRRWLASVIVDVFEEQIPPPDDIYIEDLLLQVMEDEFEVVIEDDSATAVAKDLVRLWLETRNGEDTFVLKFEGLADVMAGRKVEATISAQSDDEGDLEDDENEGNDNEDQEVSTTFDQSPGKHEPHVDEDGFTLVHRKGKGQR